MCRQQEGMGAWMMSRLHRHQKRKNKIKFVNGKEDRETWRYET